MYDTVYGIGKRSNLHHTDSLIPVCMYFSIVLSETSIAE